MLIESLGNIDPHCPKSFVSELNACEDWFMLFCKVPKKPVGLGKPCDTTVDNVRVKPEIGFNKLLAIPPVI